MELTIQLSDKIYERLLSTGSRIQGTIGLTSPHVGNFNEHVRHTDADGGIGSRYIRLRHGRATVNEKRVCLSLRISLDEANVIPSEAIEVESRQASNFVDEALYLING